MIAAGRRDAAVYIMPEEPAGPDGDQQEPPMAAAAGGGGAAGDDDGAPADAAHEANGAAAAAAAAAAHLNGMLDDDEEEGNEDAAAAGAQDGVVSDPHGTAAFQAWLRGHPPYQQQQLLDEHVPPTDSTPPQLGAVRIPLVKLRHPEQPLAGGMMVLDLEAMPELRPTAPLYLAVAPLKPGSSSRRYPVMCLSRSNATWFQVRGAHGRLVGQHMHTHTCYRAGHGLIEVSLHNACQTHDRDNPAVLDNYSQSGLSGFIMSSADARVVDSYPPHALHACSLSCRLLLRWPMSTPQQGRRSG